MKKAYETPALYIERFDLAQSIATSCGGFGKYEGTTATHGDIYTCTFLIGGAAFFTDDVGSKCNAGELPDLCYNGPSEGSLIFAS